MFKQVSSCVNAQNLWKKG